MRIARSLSALFALGAVGALALPATSEAQTAPKFPFEATLVSSLGFRSTPGTGENFVIASNKYLDKGSKVKITGANGPVFQGTTQCQAEFQGKSGWIRCDKASDFVVAAPAGGTTTGSAPASTTLEKVKLARDTGYRVSGEQTFFFRGEFMIDADGAPTAYHPGYTCDASYKVGWKRPTNINCSARSNDDCRIRGFRDNPAPGANGTLVRCGTTRVGKKKWQCSEISSSTAKQGGCSQDSSANSGLDNLANAGYPGNFYGIVTNGKDGTGDPIVQKSTDPAPGYYVSATALGNGSYASGDPRRYVDSTKINYIALPPSAMRNAGAKKGDFVTVINWNTGTIAGAIFADVGSDSDDDLGEGSIALAAALGVKGTPKGGGAQQDIVYIVHAGSTKGFPTSQAQVTADADAAFKKWGGVERLKKVAPADWMDDAPNGL